MKRLLVLPLLLAGTIVIAAASQASHPRNGTGPIGAGRAANGAIAKNWKVVPDLEARLAKYKIVSMPFSGTGLTLRERRMVGQLVDASQYLEAIFWRQNDPGALTPYRQLEDSTEPLDQEVGKLLFLNAGRFDLLDENKAFLGTEPLSPGHGFYPPEATREQLEAYVRAHPEKKAELYAPQSVVMRHGEDWEAVPYHIAYRAWLEPAARALREAAALSSDEDFARFLRLRATALLTDDYYASDLAWLDLKDPKFDVIFAPYETYLDDVLGVKTSYGAAVLVRNETESKRLAVFQKYVPDIQDALPLPPADRPSKLGLQTPMEVMDSPFRAGDLEHGYQAVADNLPNDPKIHQEKGSKKIFFKNFMDARVNYIVVPLAKRVMRPDQAALVNGRGYMAGTLMHEIAHGLGPAFARVDGKQVDIREAIGPAYSGLEEAKADVVGMFGLLWLIDHGYLPARERQSSLVSYVADMFRTMRFGVAEAHGQAELMEFNYLEEKGAVVREPASGKYRVDAARIQPAIEQLARELLEQEATGDRARAESWFAKYDVLSPSLKTLLSEQHDIPVDIAPVFSFPVKVQ
jgi:hypothetical protein